MKRRPILLAAMIALTTSLTSFGATTTPSATPNTVTTEKFTPAQTQQIQQIVHDYLVANPQVLVEASQALQAQQEKQMQTVALDAIKANKAQLFNNQYTPSVGSKDAAVTVVEFFDYQCGHCRAMTPIMKKMVDSDKNVRFVFKELPIFGGASKYAAEAALAANMQGKYYPFHELLFQATGPLNEQTILNLAKKAGLNIEKLKADMKSEQVQKEIQANFQLAQDLKIMGTPTFVLGNKAQTDFRFIPGATSFENLQKEVQTLQ